MSLGYSLGLSRSFKSNNSEGAHFPKIIVKGNFFNEKKKSSYSFPSVNVGLSALGFFLRLERV